jgi:hypothetical protein
MLLLDESARAPVAKPPAGLDTLVGAHFGPLLAPGPLGLDVTPPRGARKE